MKIIFGSLFLMLLSLHLSAQVQPDAIESNPVKMGWMQGFPPPDDKIISAVDGSFFKFPALRYSVCHMRQFMPTTIVKSDPANQYKI
ncbi:MAG: hypothetical protein PHX54_00670 [Lentimicrobiaceae bacterium]|nr:hypothetical protein [Lentimicrobiaceae bacterium]